MEVHVGMVSMNTNASVPPGFQVIFITLNMVFFIGNTGFDTNFRRLSYAIDKCLLAISNIKAVNLRNRIKKIIGFQIISRVYALSG